MALPFVADTAKLAFVGLQHGQEVVNTIHFRTGSGWGSDDLEELADAALAQWIEWVLPFQSVDFALQRVEARGLREAGDFGYEADADSGTTGELLGASDNNATATVVSLRTGRTGKSRRGRIFVGGVPNDRVVNGFLEEAYRTSVAVSVNNMLGAITVASAWNAVVVSYRANNEQRVTPLVTPISQAISVTPYPGSANRRRPQDT